MFYPSSSLKIENLFRITACFHKGSFQQGILLVYVYVPYMQYKNILKYSNAELSASGSAVKLPFQMLHGDRTCLACGYSTH